MHRALRARVAALCCAACLLGLALPARALEKLVLQLKWENEFQFAGYYAALWQGYYEREGLEVEIRSAMTPQGQMLDATRELAAGRADFAIGAVDILMARGRGEDVVILAPIFQRSPLAVYALQGTRLSSPEDLAPLRIASFDDDNTAIDLRAALRERGLDFRTLTHVAELPRVDTLVAGKADAIVTYGVSAEQRAAELGVQLTSLHPADFGMQSYGDTLYTTGMLARRNPQLVERFTRASLEGWRYAHAHREEIADRISNTLPRHLYAFTDTIGYNRTFARLIDRYTLYPEVDIGTSDRDRWERTYRQLLLSGLIATPFEVADLFVEPDNAAPAQPPSRAWIVAALAAGIVLGVSLLWWRRGFPFASAVLVVVVAGAEMLIESQLRDEQAHRTRLAVTEQLGSVRARLESVVNSSLSLTNGVAAFIAANPDLDQARFESYARPVLLREPALLNVAAAPDLVVRFVFPVTGNEALIGLDYRQHPTQREGAERVLQTGEMVVAGPIELVQGGAALIGRVPVYVDTPGQPRRTWGIVSSPILMDAVLRTAGLDAASESLRIALRGRDGRGARGASFYGEASVFDSPDVVTLPVQVGGGSWQIGALPRNPRGAVLEQWALRLFALGLIALVITVVRARAMQRAREREYARAMERQAKQDTLTGLPNRASFKEQLASALARSTRSGARHAVLFIDLDDFKSVNDNLGHDAGDRLLKEVAQRVRGCVRSSDSVARLSGDEFTAILYDVASEDSSAHVAESIVDALGRAFRIDGNEIFCGASVGVAIYPDDATDPETLITKADQAMYSVKQSGRNGWHFYTREMHERSERRHRLYNELAAAIDAEQLMAWFQPIVDVTTGRIVACEALARWRRPDGSWVSPAEFVEVAEERGLVNRLDYYVMHRAIEEIRRINGELETALGLSVNVSPRIFSARNQDLARWTELARFGARELRLSVEITERVLFGESEQARHALDELAAARVGISIDDFGTGFSSLGYLMRFPVDTIKIDRSFTRAIGMDSGNETLVETILAMAQRLGKKVVAEGVETEAHWEYLRRHGCAFAQGYLFGKPMSGEDFQRAVLANHATA